MSDLPKYHHDWIYQEGTKCIDLKYGKTLTKEEADAQIAAYRLKFNNIYNGYIKTQRSDMNNRPIDLVITKYPNVYQALIELGIVAEGTPNFAHVEKKDLYGKHACGILPHTLSSQCDLFTEIHISMPGKLRGKVLTVEEVKKYMDCVSSYKVTKL